VSSLIFDICLTPPIAIADIILKGIAASTGFTPKKISYAHASKGCVGNSSTK